jgi:hypothetical protein
VHKEKRQCIKKNTCLLIETIRMFFINSLRKQSLIDDTPYRDEDVVHYPLSERSSVTVFGMGRLAEMGTCENIWSDIIHHHKLIEREEFYLSECFDHYRVELQPKRQFDRIVVNRTLNDADIRRLATHIRYVPEPARDEAKLTLFVPEPLLTDAISRLVTVFPTANTIGNGKCPSMSQTINALIFYTTGDNFARRTFGAREADIAGRLPKLIIEHFSLRGSLKRRHTVSIPSIELPAAIVPPPPATTEFNDSEGSYVIHISSSEEEDD